MTGTALDGILVQWGDRLFYPGNRRVRPSTTPKLQASNSSRRADAIRKRIAATVTRRAPQVMVKVTGGGRGMNAIAAHFRYITKHGRLAWEDDRGLSFEGKEALRDLADQWRFGGAYLPDEADRREAFNIMLSMPRGTDPQAVLEAARRFAKTELSAHRYVMVLHDHQANPHVHLSVKATAIDGHRLNPRKADLQRWRETFAEKLRELGVDAEATRQATRGAARRHPELWQMQAGDSGRLRKTRKSEINGEAAQATRHDALEAWAQIGTALAASDSEDDRSLAVDIRRFVLESPVFRGLLDTERAKVGWSRSDVDRPVDRSATNSSGQPSRNSPPIQPDR